MVLSLCIQDIYCTLLLNSALKSRELKVTYQGIVFPDTWQKTDSDPRVGFISAKARVKPLTRQLSLIGIDNRSPAELYMKRVSELVV